MNGHELHEAEYAYDVTLRLGRLLMAHDATVYIIVRRTTGSAFATRSILSSRSDQYYLGGDSISINQKSRLQKRADIINSLFHKNRKTAKSQQELTIHLDSRQTNERIDIFFYHKEGSAKGKAFAELLYSTIKNKYDVYQPGRGIPAPLVPATCLCSAT